MHDAGLHFPPPPFVAWPSRGGVDGYPWDYDPSQRHTRFKTGLDYWPNAGRSVSSPHGWLGSPVAAGWPASPGGVLPFLVLIDNAVFAQAYMRAQVRPAPWVTGGIAVERAGGIPWQTAQNPTAALGLKSG